MQASCVIVCTMATILVVIGSDHADDRNACDVSHTTEHPTGNAALLQQALSSSPDKATSQKQNEVKKPHVAKPSQATQASTPTKEHSKSPTKSTLVVKAAKLIDQTKARAKSSLLTKQSKVTHEKQRRTADKEAKPVTVKEAHKASDKVQHKLAMATKVHKAASHGRQHKHRDKAKENAASEGEHATKRKRKKHMPGEEDGSQMSQLLFAASISLPLAFLMFGSPFGSSPTLGETKLRDHPELFSEAENSHD